MRTPPPRDSLLLFSARLSPPPTARPSYRLPNTHTHTPAGDPNLLELFLAESSQLLAAAAFDDASLAPGPSTVAAALRRLAAQERSLRVELALADREQADWEEEFAGSGGGRAGSSAGATVASDGGEGPGAAGAPAEGERAAGRSAAMPFPHNRDEWVFAPDDLGRTLKPVRGPTPSEPKQQHFNGCSCYRNNPQPTQSTIHPPSISSRATLSSSRPPLGPPPRSQRPSPHGRRRSSAPRSRPSVRAKQHARPSHPGLNPRSPCGCLAARKPLCPHCRAGARRTRLSAAVVHGLRTGLRRLMASAAPPVTLPVCPAEGASRAGRMR